MASLGRILFVYNPSIRLISSVRRGFTSSSNTFRGIRLQGRKYSNQSRVETWESTVADAGAVTKPGTWTGNNFGNIIDGWTSDRVGRAFLAGGSLIAIGSLCYYGLGLSNETGAIDRAKFWPTEIRQRINKTYTYFASGLGVTALAAYGASRAQPVMRFMITRPILSSVTFLVSTIGSAMLCYAIPYTPESLPAKLGAFTLFSSIMGATLAPVALMAGPLVARAALYTAGVVGGLSLTAACAPSQKYLYMSGPLSLGLGVVFVASIGGLFVAPGTALFSGLHTIYMYGGLVLFGGYLLYDTQKIIHHAENMPYYDPVNMSIGIYLDTINIFIRILYLLAGSNNRKR